MPFETPEQSQRPDIGVESVSPAEPVTVSAEQYPWLSEDKVEVPTVEVRLEEAGVTFRYGSLVGGNNNIERIADDVPPQLSSAAERCMFKGLSMVLQSQRTSTVECVPYTDSPATVYKTTNKGNDAPRLFFSVTTDETGRSVVLKLAVATHKKQQQLLGVIGGGGRRRQKKDG